jgi:hypothetical protein
MPTKKYKLREPAAQKAFLWFVPIALVVAIVATDLAGDGISVGGIAGAFVFGAMFCGLNWLYFVMTERLIFKDRVLDVRFYRSGHLIPYEGVTSAEIAPSGEISVEYRVRLHDGRFTSYSLPAVFHPEEPQEVFDEIRKRVEAAKSEKQEAGR